MTNTRRHFLKTLGILFAGAVVGPVVGFNPYSTPADAKHRRAEISDRNKETEDNVWDDAGIDRRADDENITIDTIILDFDGTLTKSWEEAGQFVAGYKRDIADIVNFYRDIDEQKFLTLWCEAEKILEADPLSNVWNYNGLIVASAQGDDYLTCKSIASLIFDQLSLYKDGADREKLLYKIYKQNYNPNITVFREDADEFLSALEKCFNVVIVTNSETDKVKQKLSALPSKHPKIKVYGDAKKCEIDNSWTDVPETASAYGLDRPVLLRRKQYHEVLAKIIKDNHTTPEHVLVFGDNYELDLALPRAMGMTIAYIPKDTAPKHEIETVLISEKGFVAWNLKDAGEGIMEMAYARTPVQDQ